jgi:hypothetical protein
LNNGVPFTARRIKNIIVPSKTPKIATPLGKGLTLVVDVVEEDEAGDEADCLEVELLVVVARMGIELRPSVVMSRQTRRP